MAKPKVDERPVVGVVAFDPAYSGPCGVCVREHRTLRIKDAVGRPGGELFAFDARVRAVTFFRKVGDAVAAVCRPGERLAFVAEQDAFGSLSVARKLGIAIGIMEGLVVDMNAVAPESRIDVSTSSWRLVLGKYKPRKAKPSREDWKRAAVKWALGEFGLELRADAAEALAISEWWVRRQGVAS